VPNKNNREIIATVFAETAKGNARAFVDAMAEDARYVVKGSNSWSRTYEGKAEFLEELVRPLLQRLDGGVTTHAKRILVADDLAVVEARGKNRNRSGEPYENEYCFVIRLANGKMIEIVEYADTELVTRALGERPVV
jgi:hypothetical protein